MTEKEHGWMTAGIFTANGVMGQISSGFQWLHRTKSVLLNVTNDLLKDILHLIFTLPSIY